MNLCGLECLIIWHKMLETNNTYRHHLCKDPYQQRMTGTQWKKQNLIVCSSSLFQYHHCGSICNLIHLWWEVTMSLDQEALPLVLGLGHYTKKAGKFTLQNYKPLYKEVQNLCNLRALWILGVNLQGLNNPLYSKFRYMLDMFWGAIMMPFCWSNKIECKLCKI